MFLQTTFSLSEKEFAQISEMVYDHCGICLHEGKKELVRARIGKQLSSHGFAAVQDYIDYVVADTSGKEFSHLIDVLSTNFTGFFREPDHFHYLKQQFLPSLLEKKRSCRRIRAWSAGCSSGEEPYSMAIVLCDALEGRDTWDVKLLATDISQRMLRTARAGCFDPSQVEMIPLAQRRKYFISVQHAGETICQVAPDVQNLISFRSLNLIDPWPFKGPLDFIFCRNVMIYFDKATQQQLVNRFWDILESGGVLLTGHSESLIGISHKFQFVQPSIYVKP